jgi:hypothetical protein
MARVYSVPVAIGWTYRRLGMPLLRTAAAVTVLWFLWRHVGTAPFKDGLRAVTWPAVVAAVTLTALTTVCSAWRWRVAAQALGIGIGLPAAVRSYYRSLFLNSVLIGGVLGDVHRAVTHGRRSGDVGLGLRAVAWERLCGQVIQAVVTVVVLLIVPSPVRPVLPYVLAGVAGVAGSIAPLGELLVLLLVVQVATVIPLSVGGWGMREGAAAWAFAAAGFGAATGVMIATLYAVLMLTAVAPGAGLLLGDAVRHRRHQGRPGESRRPDPAPRELEVVRD